MASQAKRISAVSSKLKRQFGEAPEKRLMFAIFETALDDLIRGSDLERRSARAYLIGNIHHAEICGVDSDYIRRVISDAGIHFDLESIDQDQGA